MKFLFHSTFLLVVALGALPLPLSAQRQQTPAPGGANGSPDALPRNQVFQIRRTDQPPELDGRIVEPAWEAAERIPLPIEITPGDNVPAQFETDCRLTYDASHLYLACRAHDPDPESIRAALTDRDGIFGNHDRISFLVDAFNDSRRGFVFEVSAAGVQADLVYDERTSQFDASWDGIWESGARITDSGYEIEAAIPFGTLRFPNTDGVQTWRFWINRMRPRSQLAVTRTNTRLRDESCQLCQAHLLTGLSGMDPGLNLELVPTLTGRRADAGKELDPGAPPAEDTGALDPGLDARWSLTSNLTLNATLNPDFSQVEADAPQLDANNAFALQFPEKRAFFLEGADLFATPLPVVFTRTIADPLAGAKLTGKAGPHALGALVALDETNHLLVPGPFSSSDATLEGRVASTLLRYRKDLGEDHTVGGTYTGRFGAGGYRSQVFGIDVLLRPSSTLTWSAQALASRSRPGAAAAEPARPAGSFAGEALWTHLRYEGRTWHGEVGTDLRTPGFRADAGFLPQTDFHGTWLNASHHVWGNGGWLTLLQTNAGIWRNHRASGGLISEGFWLSLFYEGPLQSTAWLNPVVQHDAFAGEEHELRALWAGFNLRPLPWLQVGLNGNGGDQIDFRNGGKGRGLRLGPSATLQLGRRAELGVTHSLQRLERSGEEVFSAQVGELKGVYNLSARAFVRGIAQYRRTQRSPLTNPGLERPLGEELFAQLLFSYKVNPLTVLFLGMTDDRIGFQEDGRPRVALTPSGRVLFFKVGYAWRP